MVSSRQLGVAPHAAHDRGEGPAKSGLHVGTTLSAVIVLQIMSAFGIQWYTVAHLGVGAQADALYAGGTLPQIATAFLMEPLGFVLIPFLSSKTEADRDRAGWPLLCAIARRRCPSGSPSWSRRTSVIASWAFTRNRKLGGTARA